jgi:hypothetical protein
MSEREKKLVFLAHGKTKLHAQSSFHCDALLEGTTKCSGVFEDGVDNGKRSRLRESEMPRLGVLLVLVLTLANVARAATSCAGAIDLAAEEAAGGHTIAQHVGKTEEDLRLRLEREPHIPAASSFRNLGEAERFVDEALRAKAPLIERWLRRARPGERFPVYGRADGIAGYGIPRATGELEPMSRVVVVLKKTEDPDRPYIVLTAYPEP